MIDAGYSTTMVAGRAGRIAVVDHGGQGPDVILMHGGGRSLLDWEAVRPSLTDLRLVAMDLRGHGRSTPPSDDDYGWDGHLSDLDAVITTLGLRNPYLVGHSLGGMIAIQWATTRPGCPGVVNVDGFGGGVASLYRGLSESEFTQRRAEQLAIYTNAGGEEYLDATQVDELIASTRTAASVQGWDPDLQEANAHRCLAESTDGRYTKRPAPHLLPALMAPLEGWDPFVEVRRLSCPALIIQSGRRPDMGGLPPRIQELTEALVTGITEEMDALRQEAGPVRAVRINEAGHMVPLDAPETLGHLIRDFIVDAS